MAVLFETSPEMLHLRLVHRPRIRHSKISARAWDLPGISREMARPHYGVELHYSMTSAISALPWRMRLLASPPSQCGSTRHSMRQPHRLLCPSRRPARLFQPPPGSAGTSSSRRCFNTTCRSRDNYHSAPLSHSHTQVRAG